MRHTRIHCIRVYAYMYTRICVYVYAYWADAYYAYILVRIYLSCTVHAKSCQVGIMLLNFTSFYKTVTYWNICFHSSSKMEELNSSTRNTRDRHLWKWYATLWCSWRSWTNLHLVQKWQDHFFQPEVRLECMAMLHILDKNSSIRRNILTHSCQWITRGYNIYLVQLRRQVNVKQGSCPGPCLWGQQDYALHSTS